VAALAQSQKRKQDKHDWPTIEGQTALVDRMRERSQEIRRLTKEQNEDGKRLRAMAAPELKTRNDSGDFCQSVQFDGSDGFMKCSQASRFRKALPEDAIPKLIELVGHELFDELFTVTSATVVKPRKNYLIALHLMWNELKAAQKKAINEINKQNLPALQVSVGVNK